MNIFKGENQMKKIIALILALMLTLSFAACSNKENTEINDDEIVSDSGIISDGEETTKPEDETNDEGITKPENENNKGEQPQENVQTKPQENKNPEQTTKPEQPAKPEPEAPKTVGNILLADFKSKASSSSALSIAEALIGNEIIPFMGGAMEVEPGLLQGFDNAEIKGFKEGAVFMPMIGTIPFIGYVFTLEDGTDAASFISKLKSNANLRWNICTTADEMVAGSVGNKVFFVMCPTEFAEE